MYLYFYLVLPRYSNQITHCGPACGGDKRGDERERGEKHMRGSGPSTWEPTPFHSIGHGGARTRGATIICEHTRLGMGLHCTILASALWSFLRVSNLEPASNLRTGADQCQKWIQHPQNGGAAHQRYQTRGIQTHFHARWAFYPPDACSARSVRPPSDGPLSSAEHVLRHCSKPSVRSSLRRAWA